MDTHVIPGTVHDSQQFISQLVLQVECFSLEPKSVDVYVCPAEDQLIYGATDRNGYLYYSLTPAVCSQCKQREHRYARFRGLLKVQIQCLHEEDDASLSRL